MKKKIILVCLGGYNPEIHGGSKQQELIIKKLSYKYNFKVISFSKNLESTFALKLKKIFRIKITSNIFDIRPLFKLIFYFILNAKKIDLVHLRGSSKKNIILILLSKVFNKKIIYTPTRYLEDDIYTIKKTTKILFLLLKKISLLHCISPIFFSAKNNIVKKIFKFIYLPNAVDISIYKPRPKKIKKLTILCVGFFSKVKNQYILYKAWKNVLKKINCKLHFVGSKNFNYYLSANNIFKLIYDDAKKNGLLKNITFTENVKKMSDVYKAADIFVLPSRTEGMPNSLLEAMSSGLPCVASKLDFITTPLIKHRINGFLFNSSSSKDLEKYLYMLLSSKKMRNKIGLKARNYVKENHGLSIFIKYKQMYEKILN